jgi:hypothetical protein
MIDRRSEQYQFQHGATKNITTQHKKLINGAHSKMISTKRVDTENATYQNMSFRSHMNAPPNFFVLTCPKNKVLGTLFGRITSLLQKRL